MCQSTVLRGALHVLRGALHAVSHEGVLEDWRVAGLTPLPALRYTKEEKGTPRRGTLSKCKE